MEEKTQKLYDIKKDDAVFLKPKDGIDFNYVGPEPKSRDLGPYFEEATKAYNQAKTILKSYANTKEKLYIEKLDSLFREFEGKAIAYKICSLEGLKFEIGELIPQLKSTQTGRMLPDITIIDREEGVNYIEMELKEIQAPITIRDDFKSIQDHSSKYGMGEVKKQLAEQVAGNRQALEGLLADAENINTVFEGLDKKYDEIYEVKNKINNMLLKKGNEIYFNGEKSVELKKHNDVLLDVVNYLENSIEFVEESDPVVIVNEIERLNRIEDSEIDAEFKIIQVSVKEKHDELDILNREWQKRGE
jgi:hypothetical protein